MTTLDALERDLGALPGDLGSSTLAEAARALVFRLEEAGARDAPVIVRELRNTMAELRDLAKQAPQEADQVDEIAKRRAARLSGAEVSQRAVGSDVGRPRSGGSGGKRRPRT